MAIKIRAKNQRGFCRCKRRFGSAFESFADNAFTQQELAILKAEPMLEVVIEAPELEMDAPKAVEDMTVEELKGFLTEQGVEIPAKAKKAELVTLAHEAGE